MVKSRGEYLGHSFRVGSTNGGVYSIFFLDLLVFHLPASFLFLDFLHGLRSLGFHYISPHRYCRGLGPCRGRLFATGLDLGSWQTPGSGCWHRGIVYWRVNISARSNDTIAFQGSLPRFRLLGLGFLNFTETDRNTRGFLPIVVLGPHRLDRRGMDGDRSHLRLAGLLLRLRLDNYSLGRRYRFLAGFSDRRFRSFIPRGWRDIRRKLHHYHVLLGNFSYVQVWFRCNGNGLR